jgi:hypothetical protein
LAGWKLPAGSENVSVDSFRVADACSFMLSASAGIPVKDYYRLTVGSHRLHVPWQKLSGNRFIVLLRREFTKLVNVA